MTFRLASYGVCIVNDEVLLTRWVSPHDDVTHWTLPGGGVDPYEDPFDAVIREVAEETGYEAVVERLLGVDSRVIPAAERVERTTDHQNVGVFYRIRITGGTLRPEPGGDTTEPCWTPLSEVPHRPRSSLVDIGITLALTLPPTGHVPPVPITGLLRH
ncbi:NUDIX hydrolase [Actinoplanes philippinensis]|uniref:NUDIX hydrolase n=1 Tax=Actinoplanes philippinensis TaxID=35752 RepID=UPI0033D33FC8